MAKTQRIDARGRRLITIKDVMNKYGLGRVVSKRIVELLPHIRAGDVRYVYEDDVEAFLEKVMISGQDIMKLTKEEVLNEWIQRPKD